MPRTTPPDALVTFGSRVRRVRLDAGLSQMEVAERGGLHFTWVSAVERGTRNPTLMTIVSLAEGLGIDPAELVSGLRRTPPSDG